MNRHKDMILMKLWVTKEEKEELMDKLSNMILSYLKGDGLSDYLRIVDIIKGIYQRGDFRK